MDSKEIMEMDISIYINVELYILSKIFYMKNVFDVNTCAGELNLSPDIFMKVLLQIFDDINLKRLAIQLRIEDAKDLLNAQLPISKISKLCGFSHSLSFIYYFKKETGQLPLRWRRNMC